MELKKLEKMREKWSFHMWKLEIVGMEAFALDGKGEK
jgi:hypothetical protein